MKEKENCLRRVRNINHNYSWVPFQLFMAFNLLPEHFLTTNNCVTALNHSFPITCNKRNDNKKA